MKEAKNRREAKYAEFKRSFDFDQRLFAAAVRVSVVYCDALFHAGAVTRIESERIKNGLQTVLKRADFYQDYFDEPGATDVHSFIETKLVQLIGEAGAKINVGRSREDQSVTAFRLWLREEIEAISKNAHHLQTALVDAGERQREVVFPAYAHASQAQPILWAHWCLAYYEMLARDRERLDEVWRRVNILPLGAADLTGTPLEIDREEIARALGFEGISANSLDAAADTDFALESIGAFSLLMIHLSRLAEDLIHYGSPERKLIRLSAASSPPDDPNEIFEVLELVRAKTGSVGGRQAALFSLMKSLPLGVHRDAQEIEKIIFESVDWVKSCLQIITFAMGNVRVDEASALAVVSRNHPSAAALIEYLVQRNVSLKTARAAAGKVIEYAAAQNKKMHELSLEELQQFSENIGADVYQSLSLEQSLASRNQIGGTAPERVFEALEQARESLERENNSQQSTVISQQKN